MSGSPPKIVDPPFYDAPIVDYPSGQQHSQAWTEYHQSVADAVNGVQDALTTGVTDGTEAAAGKIGEYMTATATVALPSGTATAVVALTLTAGDWEASGTVFFTPSAGAHATRLAVSIDTALALGFPATDISTTFATGVGSELGSGAPRRFLIGATTTVNLVALATVTGGTMSAQGTIWSRRMR